MGSVLAEHALELARVRGLREREHQEDAGLDRGQVVGGERAGDGGHPAGLAGGRDPARARAGGGHDRGALAEGVADAVELRPAGAARGGREDQARRAVVDGGADQVARGALVGPEDVDARDRLDGVDVEFGLGAAALLELPREGDAIAVDNGATGLILATAAGGTSGTQLDGVRYALGKRVTIVTATRTGAGRVAPTGESGRVTAVPGTLAADDLTPIKARILLMLGLTKTTDARELQRLFRDY